MNGENYDFVYFEVFLVKYTLRCLNLTKFIVLQTTITSILPFQST
jgi:hypothetical protein